MADVLLTEGNNGGTVSLRVAGTLEIQLSEVPTTGYRWTPVSLDLGIFALMGEDFQAGSQSGVGGGGLHRWRLSARMPGSTRLEFHLVRSWQPAAPKSTFGVQIEVS